MRHQRERQVRRARDEPRDGGLQAKRVERLRQWYPDRRRGGRLPRTVRRVVAAVLVVLAGLMTVTPAGGAEGVRAVTVTGDLPTGALLRASDLEMVTVTRIPDGAIRDPVEALDRALSAGVRRGEILTDARLTRPDGPEPGPGRVAVPIRPADAATAELLTVGMHVAVLAVGEDGAAVLLAPDAVVLVVKPAPERGGTGPPIVVSVPEQSADQLVAATVVGTIALRFT